MAPRHDQRPPEIPDETPPLDEPLERFEDERRDTSFQAEDTITEEDPEEDLNEPPD